jgi:hypothetical protein
LSRERVKRKERKKSRNIIETRFEIRISPREKFQKKTKRLSQAETLKRKRKRVKDNGEEGAEAEEDYFKKRRFRFFLRRRRR